MRCIKINDFPKDIDEIKIELFYDLHIGSKKCEYQVIQDRIEKVKNDPNTYCIIGGDLLNNSIKTSVGDVYSEPISPMEQIRTAVRLFEPISDKILAICAGNHERRTYKTDGIDLMQFFANELNLASRYDYCSCLLFLRFGRMPYRTDRNILYTIYMTHGDGQGGRTVGSKANGLERRGHVVNADVIVTGHTHTPISFRTDCYEINAANSCVVKKEQLFVNATSALHYEEYAELMGMKPSSTKSPVIVLNGRIKSSEVIM